MISGHHNSLPNLSVYDEKTNHTQLREQITYVFLKKVTFRDKHKEKMFHKPVDFILFFFVFFLLKIWFVKYIL